MCACYMSTVVSGDGVLFRCIEVRALDRKLLLQSIPDVKDSKYCASEKYVRMCTLWDMHKSLL